MIKQELEVLVFIFKTFTCSSHITNSYERFCYLKLLLVPFPTFKSCIYHDCVSPICARICVRFSFPFPFFAFGSSEWPTCCVYLQRSILMSTWDAGLPLLHGFFIHSTLLLFLLPSLNVRI